MSEVLLVEETYGAAYIGVCMCAVLYGITNLQVFVYFKEYPRDSRLNKLAVCFLWAVDTVHLVICIYMVYWYLVIKYGMVLDLLFIHWTFKADIMVLGIVVVCVQALYNVRIWKMEATAPLLFKGWRRLRYISTMTIVSLCLACAALIVLCYKLTAIQNTATVFQSRDLWMISYLPLGVAAFGDFVIAASLCYLLSRCRTGFRRTDTVVSWLMFYTLNTGLLTSIASLLSIILLKTCPGKLYFFTVGLILTKLYINSFLAMLNARSSLRRIGDEDCEDIDIPECSVCGSRSARAAEKAIVDSTGEHPREQPEYKRAGVAHLNTGPTGSIKFAVTVNSLPGDSCDLQHELRA